MSESDERPSPRTEYELFAVVQEAQDGYEPGEAPPDADVWAGPTPALAERWERLGVTMLAASGEQAIKQHVRDLHARLVAGPSLPGEPPRFDRFVAVPTRNITTLTPKVKMTPQLSFE